MAHRETIRIEWDAPEYFKNERTVDWYWATGLLVVVSAGAAIWFHNILFALIIIVAGILILVVSRRDPAVYPVQVSEIGISIGGQLVPYQNLSHFWIETTHPEGPKLLLQSPDTFMVVSVINIVESVSVEQLRTILLEHLDEKIITEPLLARILERLF